MDFNQAMTMMRGKEIVFRRDVVKERNFFRDEKVPNYFCTEKLVVFFQNSGIMGLNFKAVGRAV